MGFGRRDGDPQAMEHHGTQVAPILRRTLAAGVVALLTWAAWPAESAAQTAGDPTLLAQVPSSFAATCLPASVDGIAGAEVAITCTPPGVTSVTYARFPTPELADAYYDEHVGDDGRDTGSDCADMFDSESPYHTAAGGQGRVSCLMGRRQSELTWLDGTTVATATTRGDGDAETALYEWWDDLVGRSLTPTQQALMKELPAGVSRSTCRDNGENSVKCWPLDETDVYVATYTKYADRASMDEAYAEVLADAGLDHDITPRNTKGTACNYETFWGPVRDGVVTKKLGRMTCFEGNDATDLVWTNKTSHVITQVEGYRPKHLWTYFQKYPA
jgi:hypothetical protein